MARWDTIAIVGVGLIGGSIGLALQSRRLVRRVVGIGRRESSLARAAALGTVNATTTDLAEGVRDAELIVICTPVAEIVPRAIAAARHCPAGACITDVGSTKADIVATLAGAWDRAVPFVGSHPLAGSERSGAEHATADLFAERTVVVTTATPSLTAAELQVTEFWQSLDARVLHMTAVDHDAAVAMTSHATHVVASVLAAATDREYLPLAATGWSDTTRIAAGDPELWLQILLSNRAAVLESLDQIANRLSSFRSALQEADEAGLREHLARGKQIRDALGS